MIDKVRFFCYDINKQNEKAKISAIKRSKRKTKTKIKTQMQNITNFQADRFGYGGWKHYNTIKKKAMEREFSWSGLIISLSIAFFIVFISSQLLNFAYMSISAAKNHEEFLDRKIYYLEDAKHINIHAIEAADINYAEIRPSKQIA